MATAFGTEQASGSIAWTYLALGNENGLAIEGWLWPDKTVQAYGVGTVTVEGSNDASHWVALNNLAGTPISLDASAKASSVILENPRYIRAVNTSGSGALVVITGSH